MNNITAAFENFGHRVSHAWQSCGEVVEESCSAVSEAYEHGRQHVVLLAREKLPVDLAYVVERVSTAIPEAFVALAALWNGILTIPALLLSWGRKVDPMLPIIRTILKGDMSAKGLGEGIRHSLDNLDRMFERVLVPSLFVALLVDTVYSFAVGWLAQDWGKMLHGTAIALPGLFLTYRYMMWQRTLEPLREVSEFILQQSDS